MKKLYSLILVFLFVTPSILSQTPAEKAKIISNYDLSKSNQVTQYLETENLKRLERINSFLSKLTPEELQSIDLLSLHDVTAEGSPIYLLPTNDASAKTIRANTMHTGGSLGLDVNGENMVAGVWEAQNGYPLSTHLDLTGRITVIDGAPTVNFHATHVVGTIISSGDNITLNLGRGIAYEASVLVANTSNDLGEMSAQAAGGLLVSNHSYGPGAGSLPLWFFGAYNSDAAGLDLISHTNPYYLAVSSAGNDRDNFGAYNPTKGGYDLLTSYSVSKNSITSAAVNQVLNYTGPSSVVMSNFSNWGPVDDGRIKPDISSKGVGVLSTSNSSNTAYSNSSGTSMSAPAITGLLLLLQQHYNNVNSQYMLAATAKGLLLHTADEAGLSPGPDYGYGWGLANGEKAAQTITNNNITTFIEETTLNDTESKTFTVTATGTEPLMVSISWTDPAGTAVNGVLDDPNPDLVNDLDIKLTKDAVDYYPWKLNVNARSAAATRNSTNDVDNFEKVQIDSPNTDDVYTVTINHKGSLTGGSQNYSLIVTGGIHESLSTEDFVFSGLNIWPNPANDFVNISFLSQSSATTTINLIDSLGRIVKEKVLNNNSSEINERIDLRDLSKGIYFVKITQGNFSQVKKIVH